jgi:hypothetical protein
VATLDALTSRVRLELGDSPAQFTTNLTGDGTTRDFYLKVKPVDATYLVVKVNGIQRANPTDFTVEESLGMLHFLPTTVTATGSGGGANTTSFAVSSTTGITIGMGISGTGVGVGSQVSSITGTNTVNVSVKNSATVSGTITFTNVPSSGSTIVVTGTHYRYFSTAELTTFVNTAILQHTNNKTDSYGSLMTIANLPAVEEYPVALAATIEALWALATDASFDINIQAPDGVIIPRAQRFSQLSQIISGRQEQYKALCAALNVGLWRVEMGTLRRVSRTTNKLVPVYLAQEIDDARKPTRVYIENNLNGLVPTPSTAGVYDIVVSQGDTWSVEFDLPMDLTNYTTEAQIRVYPESPTLAATITVTTINLSTGRVTLSLTADQTRDLPVNSFWDLRVYNSDKSFDHTFVRGLVFVARTVTVDP